ncbi:DNA-polymerase III subunit alpha [Sesbania bispinosa]|nr:DNA-polymerase III subunit alpha [Sesbania bispinosa]
MHLKVTRLQCAARRMRSRSWLPVTMECGVVAQVDAVAQLGAEDDGCWTADAGGKSASGDAPHTEKEWKAAKGRQWRQNQVLS